MSQRTAEALDADGLDVTWPCAMLAERIAGDVFENRDAWTYDGLRRLLSEVFHRRDCAMKDHVHTGGMCQWCESQPRPGYDPEKPTTGSWAGDARALLEMGCRDIGAATVRGLLGELDALHATHTFADGLRRESPAEAKFPCVCGKKLLPPDTSGAWGLRVEDGDRYHSLHTCGPADPRDPALAMMADGPVKERLANLRGESVPLEGKMTISVAHYRNLLSERKGLLIQVDELTSEAAKAPTCECAALPTWRKPARLEEYIRNLEKDYSELAAECRALRKVAAATRAWDRSIAWDHTERIPLVDREWELHDVLAALDCAGAEKVCPGSAPGEVGAGVEDGGAPLRGDREQPSGEAPAPADLTSSSVDDEERLRRLWLDGWISEDADTIRTLMAMLAEVRAEERGAWQRHEPSASDSSGADLDRLESLYQMATPGPWTWEPTGEKDNAWCLGTVFEGEVVDWVAQSGSSESFADARLIVEAVNALPKLIAELRELRPANALPRKDGGR